MQPGIPPTPPPLPPWGVDLVRDGRVVLVLLCRGSALACWLLTLVRRELSA